MSSSLAVGLAALALLTLLFHYRRLRGHQLQLPPGPKGLPLIGNLLQFPQDDVAEFFATESLQKYGDIVHFSVLGKHIIVLNSYAAAYDLLLRRSAIYSDRPRLPMVGELIGADRATVFIRYGENWRSQRRVWQQHLNIKALEDYTELVSLEAQSFVTRLLVDSKSIHSQIKLFVVKTIVSASFGKNIDSLEDKFVAVIAEIVKEAADAMVPGRYLVDTFPSMLRIPDWFPGASWKRLGIKLRERVDRLGIEPYEYVKAAMASGDAPKSFVSEMIETPCASEINQKWVTSAVYAAAVDTTHEAVNRFVVAMMTHPDVQRRAQSEIDSLTGRSRLPGIQDKDSLPYIDALIQEILRWHIISPLAVPHASVRDDEYRGYHIPAQSTILCNLWAISQDPQQYPDPENFNPERFLKEEGQDKPLDPRLYAFGIGRRICPGRHFGELVLYSTIVTMLAIVDILKPLDKNGREYTPDIEFEGGGLSAMRPFEARIVPRPE